jgi:hypothetical protein
MHRLGFLGSLVLKSEQSNGMETVDQQLQEIIAKLHAAMPEPRLWSGSAARACERELQALVEELHQLRAHLFSVDRWLG